MTVTAKKRFGQNFLMDRHVIERIIDSFALDADDSVLEIGPGKGALTDYLLPGLRHLSVIDIDREVIAYLRARYHDRQNLSLIEWDVLKFDLASLFSTEKKLRIIGNLPYNISTPLLFHLLQYCDAISDMLFMLQKEVVDRLVALPGQQNYGRLSVTVGYHACCEKLFTVKPGSFQPPPKVNSAIVRITPVQPVLAAAEPLLFSQLVKKAFGQRRKILGNSLKPLADRNQLLKWGFNPGARAEELSVVDFVHLCNAVTSDRR